MAEKVGAVVRRKNSAPAGLQKVLNRLAKVALSNSPCCLYECFAIALESDVDWRTLAELQLAPCKFVLDQALCLSMYEHLPRHLGY